MIRILFAVFLGAFALAEPFSRTHAETSLCLATGFAPPFQHTGEFAIENNSGLGLQASFLVRTDARWEFGLQGGYWRWAGAGNCPRGDPDACGYKSMSCIPFSALGRLRSADVAPFYYLQAEAGSYRLKWTYEEKTSYNPHHNPHQVFGGGLGAGVRVPISENNHLDLNGVLTQIWLGSGITRYVRVLCGITLGEQ